MASAISIETLYKSFGDVVALDGVDLEVATGSIFGLVGPNGSGKTTLVRTLVGALRSNRGNVSVLGIDPVEDRRAARSRIGYMPQAPVLYGDLTARENAVFFHRGHYRDGFDDSVAAALAFAGLEDDGDRMVHNLSGGVQQRVSLAVALAHRPEVLLLDEPTAGVDPELRHRFWQGFRRLAAEGMTVLITTHQMDEVIHCDRVALIRRGRILAEEKPSDLLASGGTRIRVHRNGTVTDFTMASLDDDLAQALRQFGLDPDVDRIEVDSPTLEEVILGLVDRDHTTDPR